MEKIDSKHTNNEEIRGEQTNISQKTVSKTKYVKTKSYGNSQKP